MFGKQIFSLVKNVLPALPKKWDWSSSVGIYPLRGGNFHGKRCLVNFRGEMRRFAQYQTAQHRTIQNPNLQVAIAIFGYASCWHGCQPQFDDIWRSTFVHPCIVYSFWLSPLVSVCVRFCSSSMNTGPKFTFFLHCFTGLFVQDLRRDLAASAYLIHKWWLYHICQCSCQNMTQP